MGLPVPITIASKYLCYFRGGVALAIYMMHDACITGGQIPYSSFVVTSTPVENQGLRPFCFSWLLGRKDVIVLVSWQVTYVYVRIIVTESS